MNAIANELRDIADKAEASEKLHWAKAMRAGAMQIELFQRDMERLRADFEALKVARLAEVDRLRNERDAAFAMSRCECETNECCANLMRYRDALDAVADLASWHTDDEADSDDTSPDDMVAHVNGLVRQRCKAALMGPNCEVTGVPASSARPVDCVVRAQREK